jgi:hypothetical protein
MLGSDEPQEEDVELSPEEDAFLRREIDVVLASYRGRVPDEQLELMRLALLDGAREGRRAELVRAATPRDVDVSGEVARVGRVPAKPPAKSVG